MRTIDFTPFSRSTIGFDHLFDLLNSQTPDSAENYPPYDIVRTGQDSFRITLAIAGFSPTEVNITARQNLLTVSARKSDSDGVEYIHRGIAARSFDRKFNLADHIEVESATYENGILQIDLTRRIPEAMKPRRIEIGTGTVTQLNDKRSSKVA